MPAPSASATIPRTITVHIAVFITTTLLSRWAIQRQRLGAKRERDSSISARIHGGRGNVMSGQLRVLHYVNQFFGGIGGEDQAHVGITVKAGAVGPGRALEKALGDGARVEATLIGGDNFVSERGEEASRAIATELDRLKPDLLVAGPAFGSGRYGLACALVCKVAQPERVPPAPPITDLSRARIAMVTTGGLVRKGNPDKQVSANAIRYHRHAVAELESLSPKDWEAYHAGYFNHIVNSNPNYILPLSF